MGLTVTGFNEISLSRRHCLQGTAFSRIEMPFILSESIVKLSFKWIFFSAVTPNMLLLPHVISNSNKEFVKM